jgi:hypothetical protein
MGSKGEEVTGDAEAVDVVVNTELYAVTETGNIAEYDVVDLGNTVRVRQCGTNLDSGGTVANLLVHIA